VPLPSDTSLRIPRQATQTAPLIRLVIGQGYPAGQRTRPQIFQSWWLAHRSRRGGDAAGGTPRRRSCAGREPACPLPRPSGRVGLLQGRVPLAMLHAPATAIGRPGSGPAAKAVASAAAQ